MASITADYSSYIYVHNYTAVDFSLSDSNVTSGKWADGSPPSKIKASSEAKIILNDKLGTS